MKLARANDFADLFQFSTKERADWVNPLCIATLAVIGVFFIYSAQYATGGRAWVQQLVWLGAGTVLYSAVALIDYRFWLRTGHWFYLGCVFLLLLVLIPGIGAQRGGAQRWIDFGFFSLQPSEPAKIGVLLITASILVHSKLGSVRDSLATLGKLALAVGIPGVLILWQPDFKSAIVLPPMVFAMLYVSNLSARFFAAALGVFAVLVSLVAFDVYRYSAYMEENKLSLLTDRGAYEPHSWLPLHDYQRNRILDFVAPDKSDPLGIGWNQRQSLISVGSGGFAGKGWKQGTQAQLGYLPRGVAHNDFIFSVLAEEKGFIGSLAVIGLFGLVLFNGIRIAGLARDRFGTLLALGVTVLFAVHVFVNIAMTIGLVPVTGIPLPFISYGGSFVLSCCLLQGLVQSVYRFRKEN